MDFTSLAVTLSIALTLAYIVGKIVSSVKNAGNPPLPPGPKGLPIVGNVNDLPQPGVLEAHHWLKHKDLYGPISSITIMGGTIVIINDARIALELLEKRAVKHSSRPRQVFAGEMIGWENSLALSQYNDRFRKYRKNMSRIIGSKTAASQYSDLQEAEVCHFLRHVLDSPENLVEHIRKETGAIILKITYGYTTEPHKRDPLIDMAGDAMDKFGVAAVPGAFMVDMFPFLRNVPDWFPGTDFKKTARQWGAELTDTIEKPYAFVKHQMAQGKYKASFLSALLEAGTPSPEEEFTHKWSSLSLYVAGADTTVSAVACFFLAMTVYPEVQRKAQEEIDRVIGQDRLPTMADRQNLPYVEAVVREVLRWQPVAPMGLPHTSTADDAIEGYFIPKGSMELANVWYFMHDPSVYHDPHSFKPERFLGPEPEQDPHTFVFGFGRRVCPGRILADNALYLNVARSLAVFDVSKPVGADGREIEPVIEPQPGVVSHPAPFRTQIKPRSAHHENLIRRTEEVYPWEESDGKDLENITY